MLTYKDILYSITSKLSNNFDEACEIIIGSSEGTFSGECFYVTLMPTSSIPATKTVDEKQIIASIKYFGSGKYKKNEIKLRNYEVADILENLFNRSLKVNNRFINISNVEPNFLSDEVGDMLDFLVYLNYFDDIKQNVEEFDNMQNVNMNMKG